MTLLERADQVDEHMLVLAANCVEDWFLARSMNTEDFIDRLCENYLNNEGWEIENLDTPAVRKLYKHARQVKRELA